MQRAAQPNQDSSPAQTPTQAPAHLSLQPRGASRTHNQSQPIFHHNPDEPRTIPGPALHSSGPNPAQPPAIFVPPQPIAVPAWNISGPSPIPPVHGSTRHGPTHLVTAQPGPAHTMAGATDGRSRPRTAQAMTSPHHGRIMDGHAYGGPRPWRQQSMADTVKGRHRKWKSSPWPAQLRP